MQWKTIREAAEELDVSTSTIRRWIEDGLIASQLSGGIRWVHVRFGEDGSLETQSTADKRNKHKQKAQMKKIIRNFQEIMLKIRGF